MGYEHRYDLIREKDVNDGVDGNDVKDEPQLVIATPVVTSWWKILLCNVLAATLGAGAMFLLMRSDIVPQQSSSAAVSSAAVSSAAVSSAASSSAAITISTSTISSSALTLTTPSAEPIKAADESQDPLHGVILDCGGNPTEARAKGCVYDVMMQDWVPEPCYDSVLTERYLAEGNWTWYRDGDGKDTLSDEEMRKGEHGAAWMSASYHKAHCVFSWLKIIRALRNGQGISQELLSYDHVLHCSHGALKNDSEDEVPNVSAPTNYAQCATYETWKKNFIPDEHESTD